MNVKIYVEGGGDSKELRIRCREGFRKLIEKAGFSGHMPGIIACGGRGAAFDHFNTAFETSGEADCPILLVDSEDPLAEGATPWQHLRTRDGWEEPIGARDEQVQLMVTCMETWIMADRAALREIFGNELQTNALLPDINLEQYSRDRVQTVLEQATRNCGKNRTYKKGKRSFQILESLNPNTLKQHLPNFKRFIETLEMLLG